MAPRRTATAGTKKTTPEDRLQRAEALRLKLEEGLTQGEIAERLGVQQPAVSKMIAKALAERTHPLVDQWRAMEGERLEAERDAIAELIATQPDFELKVKGYDRLLRYSDRLSKLYGADLPVKVEVSASSDTEAEKKWAAELAENRAIVAAAEARIKAGGS